MEGNQWEFYVKRFFVYNFFTSRNPELSGQFSSCGWSAGDSVSHSSGCRQSYRYQVD
jgi:hypothetical protein